MRARDRGWEFHNYSDRGDPARAVLTRVEGRVDTVCCVSPVRVSAMKAGESLVRLWCTEYGRTQPSPTKRDDALPPQIEAMRSKIMQIFNMQRSAIQSVSRYLENIEDHLSRTRHMGFALDRLINPTPGERSEYLNSRVSPITKMVCISSRVEHDDWTPFTDALRVSMERCREICEKMKDVFIERLADAEALEEKAEKVRRRYSKKPGRIISSMLDNNTLRFQTQVDQFLLNLRNDLENYNEQKHDPCENMLIALARLKEYISRSETSHPSQAWADSIRESEEQQKVIPSSINATLYSSGEIVPKFLALTSNSNFLQFLDTPLTLQYFRSFLRSEFSLENLNSCLEMRQWQLMTSSEEKNCSAKRIYEDFVRPEAPHEINISHVNKEELQNKFEDPNFDPSQDEKLFDAIYNEIIDLMRLDSLERFKRTPSYHQLVHRMSSRNYSNQFVPIHSGDSSRSIDLPMEEEDASRYKITETTSMPELLTDPSLKMTSSVIVHGTPKMQQKQKSASVLAPRAIKSVDDIMMNTFKTKGELSTKSGTDKEEPTSDSQKKNEPVHKSRSNSTTADANSTIAVYPESDLASEVTSTQDMVSTDVDNESKGGDGSDSPKSSLWKKLFSRNEGIFRFKKKRMKKSSSVRDIMSDSYYERKSVHTSSVPNTLQYRSSRRASIFEQPGILPQLLKIEAERNAKEQPEATSAAEPPSIVVDKAPEPSPRPSKEFAAKLIKSKSGIRKKTNSKRLSRSFSMEEGSKNNSLRQRTGTTSSKEERSLFIQSLEESRLQISELMKQRAEQRRQRRLEREEEQRSMEEAVQAKEMERAVREEERQRLEEEWKEQMEMTQRREQERRQRLDDLLK
ncbi:regulator of G-protein signaling [Planoprotostelium fungivorum]|uniref:Regulator of G-protein signaling n=1 Tax=Planoprotostelium fungivorum TaxID=1890364 RepID=A0A2P6P0W5_9EUKA|nr:regulator of G-protein signaling [Planoprotostelium fungivorum]